MKFITIEGIEGVGKSSNIAFIATLLKQAGKKVLLTREPGGTPLAEEIRKILLSEFSEPTLPETELLLLYAGRIQHVETVIKPALKKDHWVVCDRFNDATFAYQGAGRGMSNEKIQMLDKWALNDFYPDYTIILDAPVEVALARIQHERQLDRFEKEQASFFERIRQAYLARANQHPERYIIINASESLEKVQASLQQAIQKLLSGVKA